MPQPLDTSSTIFNGESTLRKEKKEKRWTPAALLDPPVIWNRKIPNTGLEKFRKLVEKKKKLRFDSYWDFHKWSIENFVQFWEEVWNYFDIITSEPYQRVFAKTGPGFLDNDWFGGALFNYAENVLRHRDDSVAIMYLDELGNEDTVTYAEMFEEVKLYAAAFRKNGLRKGDVVACFMSNRKEPIFAMLAVTSIGAIWGGPSSYYGARVAAKIVNTMEPKFLIAVDTHQDEDYAMNLIDYLPHIADNAPTIEKVILKITKEENSKRDLSNIRNCTLLEDFLEEGRTAAGHVPDIVFEQLPFNHPICINFTSGTTGLPKGPVHSAGTLMCQLRDYNLHLNMRKGDVYGTMYPVGWTMWDIVIPSFALGCKVFLYCGSVYYKRNGMNFWDLLAKYKVKLTFFATSSVDKMEKLGIVPCPDSNLDSLEIVGMCGSPVKKENCKYLLTKVKKDLFICSRFGATEVFGQFSGFDLNMPAYGGEIQAPSLGMDIQCFDAQGKSVVGERGELVVCTPAPNFPTGLWKDANNEKMHEVYLSKYPGVWTQNDECWINPKTRGIVIIGRSDDTIKQKGETFGAGDIYFAVNSMEELQDYICVGQSKHNGDSRAVLFVKLKPGLEFTPELRRKIEFVIDDELWDDRVPELILPVPEIPYNFNNKRMENVVRKIVETNEIPEVMTIRSPDTLKHFLDIPEVVRYNLD